MRVEDIHREVDGNLPAFVWPGGYPIYYVTADGAELCPACANGQNESSAFIGAAECPDDDQWRIVAVQVHYEGSPIVCDHCGEDIESAYGRIDAR